MALSNGAARIGSGGAAKPEKPKLKPFRPDGAPTTAIALTPMRKVIGQRLLAPLKPVLGREFDQIVEILEDLAGARVEHVAPDRDALRPFLGPHRHRPIDGGQEAV